MFRRHRLKPPRGNLREAVIYEGTILKNRGRRKGKRDKNYLVFGRAINYLKYNFDKMASYLIE